MDIKKLKAAYEPYRIRQADELIEALEGRIRELEDRLDEAEQEIDDADLRDIKRR